MVLIFSNTLLGAMEVTKVALTGGLNKRLTIMLCIFVIKIF
jgi:hypothetical protein